MLRSALPPRLAPEACSLRQVTLLYAFSLLLTVINFAKLLSDERGALLDSFDEEDVVWAYEPHCI